MYLGMRWALLRALVVCMVCTTTSWAWADDGDAADPLLAGTDGEQKGAGQLFLEENLLDPKGEFWVPRRGPRLEASFFLGAESSFGDISGLDDIPQPTGISWTAAGRYYPVSRLALSLNLKGFFGLDAPAAGTSAATVVSGLTGVRWDLITENRFSVLVDVYSGPALFAYADVTDVLKDVLASWALGAEFGAAVTFRYTLGPFTGELRALTGIRSGAARDIGRPTTDVGPFSAVYAGADVGVTWSFLDGLHPRGSSTETTP